MKTMLAFFLLMSCASVWAQGLKPDFSCTVKNAEGETLDVKIVNLDFAKEISVSQGKKVCQLAISYGEYRERAVSPVMLLNFTSQSSCQLSKTSKILPGGFLKVSLSNKEAYMMALYGNQPMKCEISHFNTKKLRDRIRAGL